MNSQKVATFHMPLKLAIVASGRTQRAIAKQARIDETRLSRLLRNEAKPSKGEKRRLARVLATTVDALFPIAPVVVHEEAVAS